MFSNETLSCNFKENIMKNKLSFRTRSYGALVFQIVHTSLNSKI